MKSIIVTWYVKEGCFKQACKALNELAEKVKAEEADTWAYLVHSSAEDSLPPVTINVIVFLEIYKDEAAFLSHVNGPVFQGFLRANKDLFVSVSPNGPSFFQVHKRLSRAMRS